VPRARRITTDAKKSPPSSPRRCRGRAGHAGLTADLRSGVLAFSTTRPSCSTTATASFSLRDILLPATSAIRRRHAGLAWHYHHDDHHARCTTYEGIFLAFDPSVSRHYQRGLPPSKIRGAIQRDVKEVKKVDDTEPQTWLEYLSRTR
jgi:hypothetical protein